LRSRERRIQNPECRIQNNFGFEDESDPASGFWIPFLPLNPLTPDPYYPIVVVVAIVIVVGNHMKVSGKSGLSGFRDFGRRIDDDHDHDGDDENGNSSCLDSGSSLPP
jgi:hypothetical protein